MADERELYIDDLHISALGYIWEDCCELLFTDSDLRHRLRDRVHPVVRRRLDHLYDEKRPEFWYLHASASKVRARLEIRGYTPSTCRRLWQTAHEDFIARNEELASAYGEHGYHEEIEACRSWTYESWQEAYLSAIGSRTVNKFLGPASILDNAIRDSFAALAIQIDVLKPRSIWMDLTDLYSDEFDPNISMTANLANRYLADPDADMPIYRILILTEGKSDSRVLSAALAALYPEFSDIYDFADFDGFRIEGGASPLARMVKAFAGIKQKIHILAIFDNDAAGYEAMSTLQRISFPKNIKMMMLPNISIGQRYPTIGPEGLRSMNINGSACSIELFLGRRALSIGTGVLNPVRWSQWNARAGRYQGELERKDAVVNYFLEAIQTGESPRSLRRRFSDMDILLRAIFNAFGS